MHSFKNISTCLQVRPKTQLPPGSSNNPTAARQLKKSNCRKAAPTIQLPKGSSKNPTAARQLQKPNCRKAAPKIQLPQGRSNNPTAERQLQLSTALSILQFLAASSLYRHHRTSSSLRYDLSLLARRCRNVLLGFYRIQQNHWQG
jgi:hypothetical protein